MKRPLHAIIFALSLTLLLVPQGSYAVESKKRALQWAYIMNFIRYISWPQAKIDPVVGVCIVGNNPFNVAAGDVELNEKTGAITVTTHYNKLPDMAKLGACDLIYFASDITLAQLSFVFSKLNEKPIVTIGEHQGFNKVGGLLQFIERNKKLGFRLNKGLLGTKKLKIHPSLMRLSD